MSNYTRGRAREYAFMKMMRDDGYVALRTAGSHGDFDVLCYKDGGPLHMFQLKYTKDGKPTKHERLRFEQSAIPEGAQAYLLCYRKGLKAPASIHVRSHGTPSGAYLFDGNG